MPGPGDQVPQPTRLQFERRCAYRPPGPHPGRQLAILVLAPFGNSQAGKGMVPGCTSPREHLPDGTSGIRRRHQVPRFHRAGAKRGTILPPPPPLEAGKIDQHPGTGQRPRTGRLPIRPVLSQGIQHRRHIVFRRLARQTTQPGPGVQGIIGRLLGRQQVRDDPPEPFHSKLAGVGRGHSNGPVLGLARGDRVACGQQIGRQILQPRANFPGNGRVQRATGALPRLGQSLGHVAVVIDRLVTNQPEPAALEESRERVVVLLRNRVELVVVTPRTANRQCQEGLAEDIDHVVVSIGLILSHVDRRVAPVSHVPEPGPQHRLVGSRHRVTSRARQEIPCDVLDQEQVVGHIVIERSDHVVAVFPGVGCDVIGLVTARLGKSHQVQPVASPVFTKTSAGEKPINDPFVRLVGPVAEEGIHLGRRGWHATEIVGHPPQPGRPVRIGHRCQLPGHQLFQDVLVNRRSGP